jgi:hypothetical protein
MPVPITWSPVADRHILRLRAAGAPWHQIAAELRVGRNAAIERARRLGVPPATRMPQPAPAPVLPRADRPPLPAGHPLTWGTITDQTSLHGSAYPHPVFL